SVSAVRGSPAKTLPKSAMTENRAFASAEATAFELAYGRCNPRGRPFPRINIDRARCYDSRFNGEKWHIPVPKGMAHMVNRWGFLKPSSVLRRSRGVAPVSVVAGAANPPRYFGVHPFVEQHPEAVFILRTHVDRKTNSEACKRTGLDFGRSVFVPMDNT